MHLKYMKLNILKTRFILGLCNFKFFLKNPLDACHAKTTHTFVISILLSKVYKEIWGLTLLSQYEIKFLFVSSCWNGFKYKKLKVSRTEQ